MFTNLEKVLNDPVAKLVSEVGFEKAAELMKNPKGKPWTVDQIREHVIDVRSQNDPLFFDKHSLKIQTKAGQLLPLLDNPVQTKIQQAIDRQVAQGRPVRLKIPKARRHGVSTKTQGIFFGDAMYQKNLQFLTVCHDMESARNMRAMFERYYQHYPRRKPQMKKVSDKMWRFPKTDVGYLIDTADELDTGRSFTFHRLHLSEVAFYRSPEVLMTGLLRAVDNNPNTMIVAESTANGMGGWWYDFIYHDNDYELLFFPWFEDAGNTLLFKSEEEKKKYGEKLDDQALDLQKTFNLSLEQLHWRSHEIASGFNGNEDLFKQEYPSTLEESFLTSGRKYFRVTDIQAGLLKARRNAEKIRAGFLEWKDYGKSVEFVENKTGWWKIQSFPEYDYENRYLTGDDPAEGKDALKKEATKTDPDYSVCTVLDRKDKRVAARFRARVDTDVFEDEIYKANVWYGSCLEVVESNNTAGGAVIRGLKTKETVNLYQKEIEGKTEEGETIEYGYRTSAGVGGTREILLSDLRRALKDGLWNDFDEDFWQEGLVFIVDKEGKPRAMDGKHDDIIFSAGLCLQGNYQAPTFMPIEVAEEKRMRYGDEDDVWETNIESVRWTNL